MMRGSVRGSAKRSVSKTQTGGNPKQMGASGAPVPENDIEKEYLYNLQQQIYFLELESQLLREKLEKPGPKMKDKTIGVTPKEEPGLEDAAPLDQHIGNLKRKYVAMQKESASQFAELEAVNNELSLNLKEKEKALATISADFMDLREEFATVKARYTMEKDRYVAENVQLIKQMEEKDHFNLQNKGEIERLKEEIDNLSEKVIVAEQAEAETKRELDRVTKRSLTQEELKNQILKLEIEVEDAEKKTEEVIVERDQIRTELRETKTELLTTQSKIDQLNSRCNALDRENEAVKSEAKEVREDVLRFRDEVKDLKMENKKHLQRIGELSGQDEFEQQKLETKLLQKKTMELRQTLNETNSFVKELESKKMKVDYNLQKAEQEIERMMDVQEEKTAECHHLQEENSKILKENELMTDEVYDAKKQLEKLSVESSGLRNENHRLGAQVAHLREKVKLGGDLNQLKVGEFDKLRQTNMQLAETLQSLMGRLTNLSETGKVPGVEEMELDMKAAQGIE